MSFTTSSNTITLLFNQQNNATPPSTTGGYANKFTINLPQNLVLRNAEVALSNLFCYYSWFNVKVEYANNTFQYSIPGVGGPYTVTLPDGIYSFADVNGYLKTAMKTNGHYLVDTNGLEVYYLSLASNATYYKVTLTATPLPSALPLGWTNPAGVMVLSGATVYCPQLIVPAATPAAGDANLIGRSSFSKLIGFVPGSYPSTATTATTYYRNSDAVPLLTMTNNINVSCSLVNTSFINPLAGSFVYTFTPVNATSGSQLAQVPSNLNFFPAVDINASQVSIQLLDDNFLPLQVLDPAITCTLIIRQQTLKRTNAFQS